MEKSGTPPGKNGKSPDPPPPNTEVTLQLPSGLPCSWLTLQLSVLLLATRLGRAVTIRTGPPFECKEQEAKIDDNNSLF
jgi:hypothetical protein